MGAQHSTIAFAAAAGVAAIVGAAQPRVAFAQPTPPPAPPGQWDYVLRDGRTVTGSMEESDSTGLTVRAAGGRIRIRARDLVAMRPAASPLMLPPRQARVRFRWGVDTAAGLFLRPWYPGWTVGDLLVGVDGRAGAQISDTFGVFGEFGISAMFLNVGAMAELTLGEMFNLGGGLFLSLVGGSPGAGWGPGLDLRATLGLGGRGPSGELRTFTIGLDVKLFLVSVYSVTAGSMVRTDTALGIAPMVMIGYDSR